MAEPNIFTGVTLDRAADGRRQDDGWVTAQREAPGARVLRAGTAGVAAEDGRLVLAPGTPGETAVLLGLDAGGPVWAEDEDPPRAVGDEVRRPVLIGAGGRRGEPPARSAGRLGLREAASALPASEAALAGYAAGLLNWHRAHAFCAHCGTPTTLREAGFSRGCPRCRTEHHPRVDPVVIMLVIDGDRVVLGRQASWPTGRYSALAGFVGPGESLEEAVAREVREEAGVEIGPPRYSSSQPWPFPSSLMLSFEADWTGGELGGVDPELEDVRWFTREEVAAAAGNDAEWTETGHDDGALLLPPSAAIARSLIERWLEPDTV